LLSCTPQTINTIGPAAITLAEGEGLEAHARSIAARLNQK
jgi:histidinol dehydrogenase